MAGTLHDLRDEFTTLTFDCYGTLIDWEAGIRGALARLSQADESGLDELVRAYIDVEAVIEAGAYRNYRDVQRLTLEKLATRFGFTVTDEQAAAFSEGLKRWPPFPDTNGALRRLQSRHDLAVLSNIDRDLFAGTCAHFDVRFEFVVTAEDVRAYKPAHAHFLAAMERVPGGAGRILHVAQSLFHDGRPAQELAMHYVWINRYNQTRPPEPRMLAEFSTLAELADALGV